MPPTIRRAAVTTITAETQSSGHRLSVDHFLWMAGELALAVEAGMPRDTEVKIRNEAAVSGVTLTARADIVQEIP